MWKSNFCSNYYGNEMVSMVVQSLTLWCNVGMHGDAVISMVVSIVTSNQGGLSVFGFSLAVQTSPHSPKTCECVWLIVFQLCLHMTLIGLFLIDWEQTEKEGSRSRLKKKHVDAASRISSTLFFFICFIYVLYVLFHVVCCVCHLMLFFFFLYFCSIVQDFYLIF